MKPVPGAPAPAARASRRRQQLHALAQRFAAERGSRTDSTDTEQLRLLSKPIFRYPEPEGQLIDGALFAFVQGNNPEVVLVLEGRRADNKHEWRFGLAQQNSVYFRVTFDGSPVWEVPRLAPPWESVRDPSKAYFVLRREESVSDD